MGGCQQGGVLVDVAHSAGDRCARAANRGGARHEAGNGRGDGGDAGNHCSVGCGAPREPVQQRTTEQIGVSLNFGKRPSEWWGLPRMNECNSGSSRCQCRRLRKRPSRLAFWSCMNECNSALPSSLSASTSGRDRRDVEVVLTGTSATANRPGDSRVGEVGLTGTSSTADRGGANASFCGRDSRSGKLAPLERVQQRTAEQIEDLPQHPEETVEAVTLVPVQQRTAEKMAKYRRRQAETAVCRVQRSWPLESCPSGADF